VAVCPGETVAVEEDPEAIPRLKSWPVPVKLTVWGLPMAESVIESVAVRVPPAVGVNVKSIVQLDPAATLPPQLSVAAKSSASVPVTEMLAMGSGVMARLESVTVCALLVVPIA